MESEQFDSIARSFAAGSSRRRLLVGLVAGLVVPLDAAAKRGKGKHRKDRKRRGKEPRRVQAQQEACWPGVKCIPSKGSNVSRCDLEDETAFNGLDCTRCNLSYANLRGADARGANFTRANLSYACLVDADLNGATIANTTNLSFATFCRTTMPDGSINNSGCNNATACCPDCDTDHLCGLGQVCCNGRCQSGQCCGDADCGSGAACCGGVCTAINTVQDCGACGNACPGLFTPNSNVTCNSGSCTFSCQGEAYDVDNLPATGCEVVDSPTGNHTQSTAVSLGNLTCNDSPLASFSGRILSDNRVHASPSVTGFTSATGSAPDWFVVRATGGLCVNDVAATITMTSASPTCYRLTVITNQTTQSTQVASNGTASLTLGSGSYSDDTDVYFRVDKTCGTSVRETASYTVQFHL